MKQIKAAVHDNVAKLASIRQKIWALAELKNTCGGNGPGAIITGGLM